MNTAFDKPGADRLAYACAKAICRGDVRTRSSIEDALLDYLQVGHPDGAADVPAWIAAYESRLQGSGGVE